MIVLCVSDSCVQGALSHSHPRGGACAPHAAARDQQVRDGPEVTVTAADAGIDGDGATAAAPLHRRVCGAVTAACTAALLSAGGPYVPPAAADTAPPVVFNAGAEAASTAAALSGARSATAAVDAAAQAQAQAPASEAAAAAVDAAADAVAAAKRAQEAVAKGPPSARVVDAASLEAAVKAVDSVKEKLASLTAEVTAAEKADSAAAGVCSQILLSPLSPMLHSVLCNGLVSRTNVNLFHSTLLCRGELCTEACTQATCSTSATCST